MTGVKVNIGANIAQFQGALAKVKGGLGGLSGMASKVAGGFSKVFAPLAALGAGAAAFTGIKDILDYGGKTSDLANRTGLLASQIVVLEEAFRQAGLEGADVATTLQKLAKNLENADPDSGIAETVGKLGLNLSDLQNMDMATKFEAVSNAIGGLASDSEKAAAASELFGAKQGLLLVNLFKTENAMADARATVGGLAESMDKWASGMDYVSDMLGAIHIKTRQFFASLVGNNLGDFKTLADYIRDLDLTKIGEGAGKFVAAISNAFKNGEFLNALWTGIKIVFQKAGELLISIFDYAAEQLSYRLDQALQGMPLYKSPTEQSMDYATGKIIETPKDLTPRTFFDILEGNQGRFSWKSMLDLERYTRPQETTESTPSAPEKRVTKVPELFADSLAGRRETTIPDAFRESLLSAIPNLTELTKPVLSSLARVGGASEVTKNPLINLQQRANQHLSAIENNTKNLTASWT